LLRDTFYERRGARASHRNDNENRTFFRSSLEIFHHPDVAALRPKAIKQYPLAVRRPNPLERVAA
jgi:hypothetical protein